MARMTQAVEVNKFNAGLITDASPLTTPDNSSIEEDNFVLNIDGSRNRRLGMDYEADHQIISTSVIGGNDVNIATSTYRWDNAGGIPDRVIEVVQIGNELKFFLLDKNSVSLGLFATETFSNVSVTQLFQFSVVDGILIVVCGSKSIYTLEFKEPSTIVRKSRRLYIRDFFGVDDTFNGKDITRGSNVTTRPTNRTDAHIYNLRNQSWAVPRIRDNGENLRDPIYVFYQNANKYPSNADSVVEALYPDANDAENRTVDRFFSVDLIKNPIGTTRAAQGYFIIDALDRGASRLSEIEENSERYPDTRYGVDSLPQDETPSGATVVTEYAGRVFYAGFPGTVINGDGHSPKMSSYVLFSKVVDSIADVNACYQEGDPTAKNAPEIVDTDGGFIRINEAYDIKKLINLGGSLFVVAANGVWRITGGTDNGFTATSYIVNKVSDRGCSAAGSIAIAENSFMFWSDDAIYHVAPDQYGGWSSNNISFGRIQNYYDKINIDDKRNAVGEYDSYERKVRWLYNNTTTNNSETKELIIDLQLQAYYVHTVKKFNEVFPKPVGLYLGLPYQITNADVNIVVGDDPVVVGSDSVIISSVIKDGISQRELGYLIVTSIDPVVKFTFGKYYNTDFRDWYSINSVGVDADAYMVTSYMSGSDFQRDKQSPYITVHLKRTEIGVENDDDLTPIGQSSCLMQARWDWSNSDRSGKWGREFQAYRYRREYIPQNAEDTYDTGYSTIVTRNKVRGNGKVLSLRFRTEPYKNLHLYGWSMIFNVAENV